MRGVRLMASGCIRAGVLGVDPSAVARAWLGVWILDLSHKVQSTDARGVVAEPLSTRL